MHHCFVTQDYAPDLGGMARRHVELCRRFPAGSLVVSTVAAEGAESFDRHEPYRIERLPFTFAQAKLFTSQLAWARALASGRAAAADLLHLGNIRPCGYAVAIASRRTGVPYLVYVNGGDLLHERRKTGRSAVKRWSARDILGRAAGIVANSRWTADLAQDVLREVGVTAAPPVAAIDLGTDPAHFAPSRDTGALRARLGLGGGPLALTVARLVPHKGQDVAIRAIAALSADHPSLRYLVVGEGPDRPRLEALAGSLGIAGRVTFAGVLPDGDVAEAYATADVYLGLSRLDAGVHVEGFGISLVEAAASGTPAVAGDSGGVRSAVRDGETGLVVAPEHPAATADALHRLLADDALRHAMGAAGRRAVETHYNWDRVAKETLDFARRCLDANVPR